MVASARSTARHLHLVRAAQSAGEAFACPLPDDLLPGRRFGVHLAAIPFVWVTAGVVAAAALALVF